MPDLHQIRHLASNHIQTDAESADIESIRYFKVDVGWGTSIEGTQTACWLQVILGWENGPILIPTQRAYQNFTPVARPYDVASSHATHSRQGVATDPEER